MPGAKLAAMQDASLFPGIDMEVAVAQGQYDEAEPPRLRRPDRTQVVLRPCSLEELLASEHQFRTLWAVVLRLDLSGFYKPLCCRGSSPGRPATDPQLLVALWLGASTRGVSSARELERLCLQHDAFKWLCGGVSINYHTLSDFRVDHGKALDELFTDVLAMLIAEDLVSVERITQDGLRVRANAGLSSFKKDEKLAAALDAAKAQVQALNAQAETETNKPDDQKRSARKQAAQERAARERQERIERAMKQMPELEQIKKNRHGKQTGQPARASITDDEARNMRMPDGGFRPAYNVQLAADTDSRAILAVQVSNQGTDQPHSEPVRQEVEQRTGEVVREHLMDGGFVKLETIEQAEASGVKIFAPPKKTEARPDPYTPVPGDSEEIIQWRQRMKTDEAKHIYKERASTSETINADLRCYRGLSPFLVRGLDKVLCVALWSALAYNLMHFGAKLLECAAARV
jgi:transposase